MSHDQPCWAEKLLEKLIPALIRSGSISEETILNLADQIDGDGHDESIALALRLWAIEAAGTTSSEQRAERMRKRIRVIKE
ncbi:hypothetical protein [Novosphingobium pentaromativorans]|uniref:Uncharacterized protein n=1 Tax=Novosphingobium pentaromativorans US6-1 TaxID=1088721 RepID=G6E7K2_9SPHN|nr:hypothetical protein [Novosphingobium pentaromativorans]AIT81598.1 hypothetical protein JI59_18400 [Novosphingobium pentaromativorans US6-1]EHJ62825.1 hypothetical protein NSU_0337 [Novosphingobium pentaromativorans US6-1]